MKKISGLVFIIALATAPHFVSAQTTEEMMLQIQYLKLQAAAMQQASTQTTTAELPSYSLPGSGSCVEIKNKLTLRSVDAKTGGEVSALQNFLARDKRIYPEGVVSGYYGLATERAVQRWQKSHGIVASGSAQTTGYGAVGAKTRAAMSCNRSSAKNAPTFPGRISLHVGKTVTVDFGEVSHTFLLQVAGDNVASLIVDGSTAAAIFEQGITSNYGGFEVTLIYSNQGSAEFLITGSTKQTTLSTPTKLFIEQSGLVRTDTLQQILVRPTAISETEATIDISATEGFVGSYIRKLQPGQTAQVEGYTVTLNSISNSSIVITLSLTPASQSVSALEGVSGTIDSASLMSSYSHPVITGTAQGTATVGLEVTRGGSLVYQQSSNHPVVQGRWSIQVASDLAPGTYRVRLFYSKTQTAYISEGALIVR